MSNTFDSPIEWETVRNKKKSPKVELRKERLLKTLGNIELNENYVPKPIRDSIDEIFKSSESTYDKIKKLKHKVNNFVQYKNNSDINWRKCLNIYIIYNSCQNNKHEILANILDNCPDYSIYINTISSTKSGNTCLSDAAYYGSDMCINYLLNRGAKLDHVNKAGESILDLVTIGLKHSKRRFPNAQKILESRYEDCRRLIEQSLAGEKLPEVIVDILPIDEITDINKETSESKTVSNGEYINEEFDNDYNFDTLKAAITEFIEDPPKFRKLITFLKATNMNELLIEVLDDDDVKELLIDNPYVLKLI